MDPAAQGSPTSPIPSPPPPPPVDAPVPAWEDASFGLDPSADTAHHIEGRKWLPEISKRARRSRTGDEADEQPLLPNLSQSWHSITSRLSSRHRAHHDPHSSLPTAGHVRHSKRKTSQQSAGSASLAMKSIPTRAPTGSLTSSLIAPRGTSSWLRRLSLLATSAIINMVLPFANGVMIATGDTIARGLILPGLFLAWKWSMTATEKTAI